MLVEEAEEPLVEGTVEISTNENSGSRKICGGRHS